VTHHRGTEDAENYGFVCREVPTDKTKPPLKRNKLILDEAQSGAISVLDFIEQTFSFVPVSSGANENLFSVLSEPLW
jgi:hypothetical protein